MVRQAAKKHKLLPYVLAATRQLPEAEQELNWLMDFYKSDTQALARAAWLRSHQYPLQYLLKTQPFLGIDVLCRPGVLIPRWETEEWCSNLVSLLKQHRKTSNINVVDLCTGTGCIPMSIGNSLTASKLVGVDISCRALRCFEDNLDYNSPILKQKEKELEISSVRGDITKPSLLADKIRAKMSSVDLITANPPYITQDQFSHDCARSVQKFEPHLALIGGVDFYRHILEISHMLDSKAVVFEVGDLSQQDYVAQIAKDNYNWSSKVYFDSAGKPRAIAVWDPQRDWSWFSHWQEHYSVVPSSSDFGLDAQT